MRQGFVRVWSMNLPDARDRSEWLDKLDGKHFDLVVVGGGITGAGILQLAARQGLRVLLLEAADFASGTSSRSSKLIHGGIRYLAMGDFAVVRETARERAVISALVPHLVVPRCLTMPVRSLWNFWKYRIGVTLYEFLGAVPAERRHRILKGDELHAQVPGLSAQYRYAVQYEEYLTDDARLVLANLAAGVEHGGVALNYLPVVGLATTDAVTRVRAHCALTGRDLEVTASGVINAAGPWVPEVCDLGGVSTEQPMVLSRGIHLCVDAKAVAPIADPLLLTAEDNRPVFVVPSGDVVYIGTTDVLCDRADRWPEPSTAEIDYLLRTFNNHFLAGISRAQCVHSWAGIRPLVSQGGKGSREISRRDEVWRSAPGLLTIAGGKLTGYRRMAEKVLTAAIEHFGLSVQTELPEKLSGGDNDGVPDLCHALSKCHPELSPTVIRRLAQTYGSDAGNVLALGTEQIGMLVSGEIAWAVQREGASQLEDVLYRRTRIATYYPKTMPETMEPVAALMGSMLNWSAEEVAEQKAAMVATEPDLSHGV